MKKLIFGLLISIISTVWVTPAQAVEGGFDASGNKFVVPVVAMYNSTTLNTCSGIMISKNVAATAAHCLIDESKQISSKIFVGAPGSASPVKPIANVTNTFMPSDYLGNDSSGMVGESDIAFVVINSLYEDYGKVELASENDLNALKSKQASLRLIGYGFTSNLSTSLSGLPNYFDGVFYNLTVQGLLNSFVLMSDKGNSCAGDSGAPILSISPRKVTLIGILTGSSRTTDGKCSSKNSINKYGATFSGISRYSNALHLALVQGMDNELLEKQNLQKKIEDLEFEASEIKSLNVDIQFENEDLKNQLISIRAEAEKLKKMKKLITCYSGAKSKTVISLNPVCPKGYKEKA